MKTKSPTYQEIANSFALWQEYVDPNGHDSRENFDAQTVEEKTAFLIECFGPETFPLVS